MLQKLQQKGQRPTKHELLQYLHGGIVCFLCIQIRDCFGWIKRYPGLSKASFCMNRDTLIIYMGLILSYMDALLH